MGNDSAGRAAWYAFGILDHGRPPKMTTDDVFAFAEFYQGLENAKEERRWVPSIQDAWAQYKAGVIDVRDS